MQKVFHRMDSKDSSVIFIYFPSAVTSKSKGLILFVSSYYLYSSLNLLNNYYVFFKILPFLVVTLQ